MECNKDEAVRAKEIAQRKFRVKDLESAKKLALEVSQLYPALEGIAQMVATLDVYSAAEKKINGDTDWYEILCLDVTADDEMVRKQYRKLALLLHPDKNKSVGTEGPFKLIYEASSVLSDKFRRTTYDHNRNFKPKTTQSSRPTTTTTGPSGARSSVHSIHCNYNFAGSFPKGAFVWKGQMGRSIKNGNPRSRPCEIAFDSLRADGADEYVRATTT